MIKKLLIAAVVVFIAYAAQNAYDSSINVNKSDENSNAREYKFPTIRELDPPLDCTDERGFITCDEVGKVLCDISDESCQRYYEELHKRKITNVIDEKGNIIDNDYRSLSDNHAIICGAIDGYGTSAFVINNEGKVIGETFGDGMVYNYIGWDDWERVYPRGNAIGKLNNEGVAFDKNENIIGRISENVFVDNRGKPRCNTDNNWCRDYCKKNCPKKQAQYKKEHPIKGALYKLIDKLRTYMTGRKQKPESSYDNRL